MDTLFNNATTLLTYLLPGFLAAWVFYGLTSHPKPPQFERTVEALVFTFVVQALVKFIELMLLLAGRCFVLGIWTETSSLLWGFSSQYCWERDWPSLRTRIPSTGFSVVQASPRGHPTRASGTAYWVRVLPSWCCS